MKETAKHREAFEIYFLSGNQCEVARQLSTSRQSVGRWAREFDWDKRVEARNAEIIHKTNAKVTDAASDERTGLYKLSKSILATAFTKDENGNTVPTFAVNNAREFKEIASLILDLMGEPERIELTHAGGLACNIKSDIKDDIEEYQNVLRKLAGTG